MSDEVVGSERSGAEKLVVRLASAINVCALYPAAHPRLTAVIGELLATLRSMLSARRQDSTTLLLVSGELVVDQWPLRRAGPHLAALTAALQMSGVEGLTLGEGLEEVECRHLLSALAAGRTPSASPHVQIGRPRVEPGMGVGTPKEERPAAAAGGLKGGEAAPDAADRRAAAAVEALAPQVDAAREAFARWRSETRSDLAPFEAVVWDLVEVLARSAQAVLPLAPLRNHDESSFVHSVNVALLVLAQGRSLGVEGQVLHRLGLAALLHDLGKLRLPAAVLQKSGALTDAEWKLIRRHPELGAIELCSLETTPDVAVLVAYEHHLRYDGAPSYPDLAAPRRPGLASRMTSVADTYDAVSASRPYQERLAQAAALQILRDRAGTFLDPFLVGNFCRLVET